MPLRRFLDCAYSLLVDGFRELRMDLYTASERANAAIGLAPLEPASAGGVDNEQALQEFEAMLRGVKR